MNITVNSTSLAKALKTAGRVIPAKPAIAVLECYRIETKGNRMIITASNMEITVKVPVVISDNQEDGVCAIPAKKFSEHISLLPDCDVTLVTKDSTVSISWAKGKTSMQMMNPQDYPTIKEPDNSQMMDVPAQELLRALSITIPACAKDDTRPQLCGVHFDVLEESTRLVASDARTLTYDTIGCSTGKPCGFTIPTGAASLLKGSIRKESTIVRLTHDDKNVSFNLGDIIIHSRIIVGKYPNYMSIIPDAKNQSGTAVANREGLIGTLKRLAACSPNLKMSMTPLSILFTARNTETGSASEEDCECNYNGENMNLGISPQRFLDVLENLTSEQIYLTVTTPTKPIIATSTEDGQKESLSLFMPVMVQ